MNILSIILQIILGLGFFMFGIMKFGSKQMVEGFKHYGYPGWFRVFTGLVEVASAVLIIMGIWNETLAAWGSLVMTITMLGAILTHIKINDSFKQMMMPIILMVMSVVVLVIQFDNLV